MPGILPNCYEYGDCFAKTYQERCKLLVNTNPYADCAFKKKDRHVTNGKYYPDNPNYSYHLSKKTMLEDF